MVPDKDPGVRQPREKQPERITSRDWGRMVHPKTDHEDPEEAWERNEPTLQISLWKEINE